MISLARSIDTAPLRKRNAGPVRKKEPLKLGEPPLSIRRRVGVPDTRGDRRGVRRGGARNRQGALALCSGPGNTAFQGLRLIKLVSLKLFGRAEARRAARSLVLEAAHAAHPERFVGRIPTPPVLSTAAWLSQAQVGHGPEEASGTGEAATLVEVLGGLNPSGPGRAHLCLCRILFVLPAQSGQSH